MNCITDANKCLDHLTQVKELYMRKKAGTVYNSTEAFEHVHNYITIP